MIETVKKTRESITPTDSAPYTTVETHKGTMVQYNMLLALIARLLRFCGAGLVSYIA